MLPLSTMRFSCGRWLFPALLVILCAVGRAAESWEKGQWHGETSWNSRNGDRLAIVSEDRARLIYFGGMDGESNVLSAPVPKKERSAKERSPNWGGHRFWLGPQSRWGWPPPKDWEAAGAMSVEPRGGVLAVREPHEDPAYPALEREYAWEGNLLRCTVRWRGGDRPSYGMHVVAIQIPAELKVQTFPWDHVPQGLVAVNGDKPNTASPLPHKAVSVEQNQARVRTGVATGKFGFYPQALIVDRGSKIFIVHPGPTQGIPIESPDFGYVTQLWVGDASATFCEMEQITPFLLPADDGWCGSTIFLELRVAAKAVD